jgi:hypothetical protein
MINVSLLRIFLNTGLTGFPTKKSGPDPITKFQPGERPKTAVVKPSHERAPVLA